MTSQHQGEHSGSQKGFTFSWDLLWAILAMGFMAYGLYKVFYASPLLKHTGLPWWSQKIFYIHLPAAWGSLAGLLLVFAGSVGYIWSEKEKWDTLAVAAAEVCFLYGLLVLITGPLWARPSWGIFWKWEDPRLMSYLALWLILGAYFLLRAYGGKGRGIRMASAALGVIGTFSVPLVYMSVKLWRSVHPMVKNKDMDASVRSTLWICLLAFTFLFILLVRVRRRLEEQQNELHHMTLKIQELE